MSGKLLYLLGKPVRVIGRLNPYMLATTGSGGLVVSRANKISFISRNGGMQQFTWDATISLVITPSLPGMKSLSVCGGGRALGVAVREAER